MKINGFNPEMLGAQLATYSIEGCELKDTYFLAPSAIFPTRLQNKPRLRKITLTFDFEGEDTHDATKKMSDLTAILAKQANLYMPDKFYYYCILTGTGKATTKAPWIEQCTYTLIGLRHGPLETVTLTESSSVFVEGNCETECRYIIDTPNSSLKVNDITVNNISGQIVVDGMESLIQQDGVNKFADCDMVSFPTLSPGNNQIEISGTAKVVIQYASYNGLNIYDGSITIYKGAGYYSEKALYFDSDGNIALDGYLTQIGSSYRALIGSNEQGYGGFYLYNRVSPYLRDDGTYKPYLEVWTSTDNHTYIEGTNELKFGVSTIANESEGNFARVRIVPEGGYLYGTWDFGQDQNWSKAINAWSFGVRRNGTHYGTLWKTDANAIYLSSENTAGVILGVKGTDGSYYTGVRTYRPSSSYNTVITEIPNLDMGSYSNFYNGSTRVGYMGYDSTNKEMEFATNSGSIGFIAGGYWRVKANSTGGTLYGAWDFGQEQFFSHTINVPAFICRSGSTKVLSFYISTTSNPCFNSDNGKDYFFSVAGTSRMAIRSAGGDMYGEWGINTDSGYVSLITDKTGNGGGKLWGTWYLGNSTAITSDVNKKNTIEDLSEKYG